MPPDRPETWAPWLPPGYELTPPEPIAPAPAPLPPPSSLDEAMPTPPGGWMAPPTESEMQWAREQQARVAAAEQNARTWKYVAIGTGGVLAVGAFYVLTGGRR